MKKEKISKEELRKICGGTTTTKGCFNFVENSQQTKDICLFSCVIMCKIGCYIACSAGSPNGGGPK
ncbi:MAG: hypothetical protein HY738_11510 [Bacteroidia bacterium]|nr:hypothetical protein [Bacteroidia bacterium]